MKRISSKVRRGSIGQPVMLAGVASGESVAVLAAHASEGKSGKMAALAAALAVALALQGLPVAGHASTYPVGANTPADCTSSTGPVTVGRLSTPDTNAQPVDGNGLDSNVAGCNASGNGQMGASVFGTFSQVLGAGGSAFGFNALTGKWASAFGLETVASGIGSTALGFGSNATNANSVAIGGAASADGSSALPVADSTLASGVGAIAIGNDGVRGAQATADGAIAMGGSAAAAGTNSIVIGARARAAAVNGIALGTDAISSGPDAVAVGRGAQADFVQDMAFGVDAHASGAPGGQAPAMAFGAGSIASKGADTAFGVLAIASGGQSLALGYGATASGLSSTAFGVQATATATNAFALGGFTYADGANSTAIGGATTTASARASLAAGDMAEASAANSVALGANAIASDAHSVALGDGSVTSAAVATTGGTVGGTTYTYAGGAPQGTVSVGAAGAERTITNVAAGRVAGNSTDAVNGSQLAATNQKVDQNTSAIAGLGSQLVTTNQKIEQYTGAITTLQDDALLWDPTANGGVGAYTASHGGSSENRISSVAAGRVASDSADAVNGSQLAATNQKVDENTGAITTLQDGALLWDPAASGGAGAYSASHGGSGENRISNVASGSAPNDAVNVQQLNAGIVTAQNWAKDYTDRRFAAIVDTVGKRANGGVASAMAMASLPQAYQPNQSAAAVAFGNYHGQTSVAVGLSTITGSGRYVFKVNATSTTGGDTGVGVGAAMVW